MKLNKVLPSKFNQFLVGLILGLLSPLVEIVSSAQISYLYSKQCDYLQITETQKFNSYTVSVKLCCLCPAGKKFVGNCNATHPNTTSCEKCEENTFISYNGHKNTKCELDKGAVCILPLVVIPGTSTKETTCGCPSGYVREGRTCSKLPDQTTTTSTKGTTTTSTTTTTTTTKSTATRKTSATTGGTTSSPRIPSTTSREIRRRTMKPTHPEKTNTQMPGDLRRETDNIKAKAPGGQNAWIVPLVIIGLLAGLLVAAIVVYKCFWRKTPLPTNLKDEDSPDSSNTSLLFNSRTDSVGFVEESSTPMNAAEPIRQNLVQACPAIPQPGPQNNAPVQGQTVAEVLRNPRNVSDILDLREKYADNLGTALGDKFVRNEIKPFYRHLGVSGTDIDDLARDNTGDTKELVYQLTKSVYRLMGHGFHRDFLVGKVEAMPNPQRNLLPPIENEWNKLIGNPHNPH